jgi:putative ABC transport system ATP-binding protein
MAQKVIELKNIVKIYKVGETTVNALRGVSYTIEEGDFVAIMGSSGSGKSTLMNILGCLDKPTSGTYILGGVDVSTLDKNKLAEIRNRKIGFVFQSYNLLKRTTALENTELPLLYSNYNGKDMTARALDSLAAVGLRDRAHHKTNQLSGGEQQRVAIARALLNNPTLILADEPTGNLDSKTSCEIITMVMVTHETDIASYARRRILLRDGLIVHEETGEPVVPEECVEETRP